MENLPEIIFQDPKENYISKILTAQTSKEILSSLISFAKRYKVKVSELSIPEISKAFRKLVDGEVKTAHVETLKKIYEGFRSSLDNIVALTEYNPKYRATWEEILQSLTISADRIKEIYGHEVKIIKLKYRWETQLVTEALFFPLLTQHKYQSYFGLFLDPKIKYFKLEPKVRTELVTKILGPDCLTPKLINDLPQDAGLRIANFENLFVGTEFFNLQGVAMTGNILKQNGMVMTTALKKIMTSESIKPFNFGNQQLNRAEILSMIYFTLFTDDDKVLNITDLARDLLDKYPDEIRGIQISAFLPHLTGITRSITQFASFMSITILVNSLAKKAKDKWLDLSNLKMLLACTHIPGVDTYSVLAVFDEDQIENNINRVSDPIKYSRKDNPILPAEEIGIPLALNWLQTLCGFGLLEIAYDPQAPADDPLYGMRYLRLTPLGLFAFGISPEYTPSTAGIISKVEFDAENSIITDSTLNSPYSLLLSKISDPIGGNRYRISARTIACSCANDKEVESRLEMIQQILPPEMAKAITPLFTEAQKRLTCGKINSGFSIITIRPELDELRRLLTTDPGISKQVTQLGRNTFLIKTTSLTTLNQILLPEGFSL